MRGWGSLSHPNGHKTPIHQSMTRINSRNAYRRVPRLLRIFTRFSAPFVAFFGAPTLMEGIGRGIDIDANNPNVLKRGRGLVIAFMSAAGVIVLVVPRSKPRPMKDCADLGMRAKLEAAK